jgi:hypothetical protein
MCVPNTASASACTPGCRPATTRPAGANGRGARGGDTRRSTGVAAGLARYGRRRGGYSAERMGETFLPGLGDTAGARRIAVLEGYVLHGLQLAEPLAPLLARPWRRILPGGCRCPARKAWPGSARGPIRYGRGGDDVRPVPLTLARGARIAAGEPPAGDLVPARELDGLHGCSRRSP